MAERSGAALALAAAAVALAVASAARADGTVIVGGSPRAIGRAGTGTVGDDGGGALLLNPAALARRSDARGQVGLAYTDDGIDWRADVANAPTIKNQIGSLAMPTVAAETGLGDWVVGLAAMTSAISDRQLERVSPTTTLADPTFLYRYAGIGGGIRRDTVTAGAARRIGDHVAVGVSIAGSRVTVTETRREWAGFSGVNTVGDPSQDVELQLTGEDELSPSAVAGVLIAPAAPIELAASIGWERDAHASGTAAGFGAGTPEVSGPVVLAIGSPTASLVVPEPVTLRTGARYIADRFVAEVDGDLFVFGKGSTTNAWQIDGLQVENINPVPVAIASLPSRLAPQTHGAVRASVDVEVIAGFLWVTGGYAFTTGGTPTADYSPTLADLGGHTVGLGIEANAGGFTVTFGASRTWSGTTDVPDPALHLDNPFNAGDTTVTPGEFSAVTTQFGILVEGSLDATR